MNTESHGSGLVKISGKIENYRCTRGRASFVFTENDRTKLGVIAVAASLAGLGGQAISTASYVTDNEEDADYVEFDLNGSPVKGWVWRSPFKDGDEVEAAAEWRNDHYEVAGISLPKDRLIALYPHCSRGKKCHIKNSIKWWFLGVTVWLFFGILLLPLVFGTKDFFSSVLHGYQYVALGSYIFFGLMTISLSRKWMPFVTVAEKVFSTLEITDPGNIDLVASSKLQRKPDDPGEYGTFYFRY
jgi:hypothetical protein